MSVRPATHSGTWYSGSSSKLSHQLTTFFNQATPSKSIAGARVLIGPHAGYAYSGPRLAETFKCWDTSRVKRVFILGPSHHVFFKGKALVSPYDYYETPLGNLPVDVDTIDELTSASASVFKYMSEDVDDNEHSFEMHAPFIYHATEALPQGVPKIVPIMICNGDDALIEAIVKRLLPFFEEEENTFVISSDFCHWGSRFDYTKFLPRSIATSRKAGGAGAGASASASSRQRISKDDLISLSRYSHSSADYKGRYIYDSIEELDKEAMRIASTGSYSDWKEYIKVTGNTICGQKPISVLLRLIEAYKKTGKGTTGGFQWIGYSQSSQVIHYNESSVSYASGYLTVA